ncbi:CAF17-like 4Fe-4S cluster assembly/insertion protein YgfZ [Sphingomicrobium aestuariivivum]|uniref:CAF17-like 4Fe-4S cluster assembly/insertion protein YgfZ n=1 Tax=Sphingomicrobium aestuariivivum TaxID=1582356 RepID=UPI001FD66225|nr:folate-binding protein [Sphingomicrobium aestuariivivum]MCJ8191412.1 folate-binding protein [Sphingomicrobium aestuariivivum]
MPATTLTDRTLLRLSGDHPREFLDKLVTNRIADEGPSWAALLTPQGKAIADFFLWVDGEDMLIDVAADEAEALAKRLTMYRLRRKIEIAEDDSLAVHWSPDGDDGHADPRHPAMGRRWLAPAADPATGYREHRLRLNICEGQPELGDLLWLECNAGELNGVAFNKGCFVGQENTARMNWRAKVNRRLFVVEGMHEKARASYPEAGLSVVHARIDAVPDKALLPDWLEEAISPPA